MATWLAGQGVSADAISLAGLVCGVAAGGAFAATTTDGARAAWLAGAVLVQLRLLANMLDGMVAERAGTTSARGELLNEVPDRLSDAATLIGLGYAAGGDAVLGFAAALTAILTAYVRALGRALTGSQEFCGPMAKQQRMALVTLVALAGTLAPGWTGAPDGPEMPGLAALALAVIVLGSLATSGRRLGRIANALGRR